MQVVILCGGQGTRIRDVADDIPKPMIPIGDRPILWHIMKSFAEQGFTDFILCLGYKSWIIKRFFLDYQLAGSDFRVDLRAPGHIQVYGPPLEENWRVTLAETGLEAMTGCRIKRIEKYVTDEHFLLTYGDGLADIDLLRLVQLHREHGKIGTVTAVRTPGRWGEMAFDDQLVTDFTEKPLLSSGRVSGGFFVFQRRLFERLQDDPDLVFELGPLKELARDRELVAYFHDGFWHAMDNSRDYKHLNDLWATGQAPWKTWDRPSVRRAAA